MPGEEYHPGHLSLHQSSVSRVEGLNPPPSIGAGAATYWMTSLHERFFGMKRGHGGSVAPGRYYGCLKENCSGIEEQMEHYPSHPRKAEEIIENANRHAEQCYVERRERLVSRMVFEKSLRLSGQIR